MGRRAEPKVECKVQLKDYKDIEKDFITIITNLWHLPHPFELKARLTSFQLPPPKVVQHPFDIRPLELSLPPPHPEDSRWHRGVPQLELITDSQILAEAINGRMKFDSPGSFEDVHSLVDLMEDLILKAWYPRNLIEDLVK